MSGQGRPRHREHEQFTQLFHEHARRLGVAVDPELFWYHTIDLGDGLVTPGAYDYRDVIGSFDFPEQMAGTNVLDIGGATGYFAFELERRGARVTCTELPALASWDRFPGESQHAITTKIRALMVDHTSDDPARVAARFASMDAIDLHRVLLDEPFWYCHRRLGSHVRRVYLPIGELPGLGQQFDLVVLSDVLLHTFDQTASLRAAASVTRERLVICQELAETTDPRPLMLFTGGQVPDADEGQWWRPNLAWFQVVLSRLGFAQVGLVSQFEGSIRPGGQPYRKSVIHATR